MATVDVTDPAREVLNQPPPLQPVNLFEIDLALREGLEREGGEWGIDRALEAGEFAGSVEALEHCRRAERNVPILRTHDRTGTGSTRSNSTRRGTCCCAARSSATSTACRGGASPTRVRTSSGRRCSWSTATSTRA